MTAYWSRALDPQYPASRLSLPSFLVRLFIIRLATHTHVQDYDKIDW